MITAPSGRAFDEFDTRIVRRMHEVGFIQYRDTPFTLHSGLQSRVYVFGRDDLTNNLDLAWAIGRKIAKVVAKQSDATRTPVLIGIPYAGQALAAAGAFASFRDSLYAKTSQPIRFRTMRTTMKEHGEHRTWIDGARIDHEQYVLVDNVITVGGTVGIVADRLNESGYEPKETNLLVLVDRQAGGLESARQMLAGAEAIYELLDLAFILGKLGLWPESMVRNVEREIAEGAIAARQRPASS